MQLAIGDRADVAGLALEDNGRLIGPGAVQVPVQAIFGGIELPALEPLGMRQLPRQDLLERLSPAQELLGLPAPKSLWGVDRLRVELLIVRFAPKVCLGFELGRRPKH